MKDFRGCMLPNLDISLPWLYSFRFFYTYESEVPEKEQILNYLDDLIYSGLTRQRADKEKEKEVE